VTENFRTNPLGEGLNLYRKDGWRGQFARIQRWHARVQEFRDARSDPSHFDEYQDFLHTFFQNCNHLADWITHDFPGGQARVEKLLADTVELRTCRDICNATKHHTLTSAPKVRDGFADGVEYSPVSWPTAKPLANQTWFVIAGGKKYDVFDLVDRCFLAWQRFVADLEA